MKSIDKYEDIINILCNYYSIDREETINMFRDKQNKYILFLLLKKYKCENVSSLDKDFSIKCKRTVNNGYKKAQEKFFINREFREEYFEIEKFVEKKITS